MGSVRAYTLMCVENSLLLKEFREDLEKLGVINKRLNLDKYYCNSLSEIRL